MTSEKADHRPGAIARRRAESSWRSAVRALAQQDDAAARAAFLAAVEHDPTSADSWLGLHHLGVDRDVALGAMEQHAGQLGVLRTRTKTPLSSTYSLGRFIPPQRLDNQLDLWRAVTARHIETGRLDAAAGRLAMATTVDDHVRILNLNVAHASSNWTGVITWGKDVSDVPMANYADLHIGRSLIELGVYLEAKRVLQKLIDRADDDLLRACAAGWCATAFERLNDTENAERWVQFAFRLDPAGDPDIARRATAKLRANPPGGGATSSILPAAEPAELDAALRRLDSLIGLSPVKTQVRSLAAQLRVATARRSQGLPTRTHARHYVFTGPAGTGKTTVARILGQILHGLGYIEKPDVREVHRVDLVGQYLGATAIKTNAVVDSALGGVLFIDEAYSLVNHGYSGGRDAFGEEALQTLLKRAEDERDRLVIILAGYPNEMEELLRTNPGLASRFTTRVHFPSYASADLVEIARGIATADQNTFDEAAMVELESIMSKVCDSQTVDKLGNARFVRNLYEKAIAQRDLRLAESGEPLTIPAIVTITRGDVAVAINSLLS
jgi:tetratricopeptide (TPR) repeat protein